MGLSKSKESYDVSSLQTKIDGENAYGSIREDESSVYSQFNKNDNERDIDILNKGETRKERIIRFGPEKRKSIPSRERVPSNTPVTEADAEILKEIVEKVKSGGAVVVVEPEERRCSTEENPVAPIQQVIEDFERKIREDSIRRRGSYLGQIYGESAVEEKQDVENKDPLEEINIVTKEEGIEEQNKKELNHLNETADAENEEYNDNDSHNKEETEEKQQLIGTENIPSVKDPLEDNSETKPAKPERRVSYRDKAEFFTEEVPRKDSIETQPLGHRQSIKDNLIEEFNSNIHDIETNRTEFVNCMLQDNGSLQEVIKKDPLDDESTTELNFVNERKKSDPLDVKNVKVTNGQQTDSCFHEIQQIMERDFDEIKNKPEITSYSYVEYTTISSGGEYPLNLVDTQKSKSKYGLNEEKQIPLNTIREIKTDAIKLRKTVEEFDGRKEDVQYVYINEMLLRCLIKLDSVNVGDDEALRQERKNAIDYVQECICLLDSRADGDEPDIEVAF